ncbi:arf-GAP with Rho-GAP domain, ANK repeat and PH domain-containing protein 1 isoform X3 [Octopus bimaculoides]|uniref:Arf-GAP with Rho-GAP domain, ANK repeat and PH domain-containing protein 1 n=1 Tax=Octopus bimaculoides TaxID=37653 RepID=A0A0L8HGT6_OCTBM|nr:arf-GAP with Rho-GAP domain, ANK repeat and PH domain-containing protein 1 isoform X3 [Octopus bimaculoides]|eukprot:XP_014772416.1 PREDICTED: arf-GAP with Rho-GAP domain, ANK repeat and PH domain-containing protein 1-like isoform X3 [Octopus bimaculoides]
MDPNFDRLCHWLKQMELEQYAPLFKKSGIINLDQCAHLNSEKLDKLGVNLSGHRKRILANLPNTNDYCLAANLYPESPESVHPPLLPPKIKPVHRKDADALFGVSTPTSNSDCSSLFEKPVPRPRTTVKKTSEEEILRPIPKPRARTTTPVHELESKTIGAIPPSITTSIIPPVVSTTESLNISMRDKANGSQGSEHQALRSRSTLLAFDPLFTGEINNNDSSDAKKPKNWTDTNKNPPVSDSGSSARSKSEVYEDLWRLKSKTPVKSFQSFQKNAISEDENNCDNHLSSDEDFDMKPPPYPPPQLPLNQAPPIPPRINEKPKSIEDDDIIDAFPNNDPFVDFSSECDLFNKKPCLTISDEFGPFGHFRDTFCPNTRPYLYPSLSGLGAMSQADSVLLDGTSDDDDSTSDEESSVNVSLTTSTERIAPGGAKITSGVSSPRSSERSGYLYKQGGVQGNKGWRKRWVIFNGSDLRYYVNPKTQISKRIIPVSCMQDVQQDIKETQYKFILKTKYRNFLFYADTLDDNILWCSTLIEAIHKYRPPANGFAAGGSMSYPDKKGIIKFETERAKVFVALKGSILCYYHNQRDYEIASPIHEIDMKLAAVKELARNKLQLCTHYCNINMVFDNPQETKEWKLVLTNAIDSALVDLQIARKIWENNSNKHCADCGMEEPTWAAIDLGMVFCLKCSGIHRDFNIVKSMTLDVKVWTTSLIELLLRIGNENANNFWEFNKNPDFVIDWDTNEAERKLFIENKYKNKAFVNYYHCYKNHEELNEALLKAAQDDDILKTMRILYSGADINYYSPNNPNMTAYQLAKSSGQRLQIEFLLQNQCERKMSSQQESGDELALSSKRNGVNYEGYLLKTGVNMKDFLRRWCLLEHGRLSYYADKKNTAARGSIENTQMLVIQATHTEKYKHSFELSTTQNNNRIYQFATDELEEQTKWMQAIAKVFSPNEGFSKISESMFDLAGIFYIKWHGIEWTKSWIMVSGKDLTYLTNEKTWEHLDLRKTIKMTKINTPDERCIGAIQNNGHCFVAVFPKIALYLQADLQHDTERLATLMQKATVTCQRFFNDQQLTADDVPVVVDKCIKFIMTNGLHESGIYRQSGVKSQIAKLLEIFHTDAQKVQLVVDTYNLPTVTGVLKRFFREMADSLLTKTLYEKWIKTAETDDTQAKLNWYKYLIKELPLVNQNTLKKLVTHLWSVAENEHSNKMGIDQLAIVFGPTLMSGGSSQNNYSNTNSEITVIRELIKYHERLFELPVKNKEIEKKIQEACEKMENLKKVSVVSDSLLLHLYVGVYDSQPIATTVSWTMNGGDILERVQPKICLKGVDWILYETVCNGTLERPIHSTENIEDVLSQYKFWDETDARETRLLVKQSHLCVNFKEYFDPSKTLMAELEFCEKKVSRKYWFEFSQAKLSYYKDTKGSPIATWRIEDLNIYMGIEQNRDPKLRPGFTFVVKNEKQKRSKDTPYFGKALYFPTVHDMYVWYAGMMFTKHCWLDVTNGTIRSTRHFQC